MRWIVAALLACLGGSALAQTLPLPTYRGVILSPQGSTPGGVVNGQCWTQSTGLFCYIAGGVVGPYVPGSGFVTPTGSPASGNLAKFSGAASITNGDLTGDVTTSGTLATTLAAGSASVLNAGTLLAARMPALTGDVTTSAGAVATTLATVNTNTGSWGDGTHIGAFTVNGKGLITAASSVAITGAAPTGSAGGDLSGTYPNPAVAKINGATLGLTTATSGNLLIGSGSSWVTQAMTGDAAITLGGVTVVSKLNGVAYGTSPSTNTVPVVTSANTVTYEAVPNAALANSATTVNGQTCTLGSTCTITASAGTVTVGTTVVASGTNGRVLYDNSGVLGELATTGSGSVVLGTGPTITLANGTGLPLTTGVSGILPVANGGTGIASGTSGGVLAYTASGTLASSGALTANLPVIGGGAGVAPTVGTRSGNTTSFGTTTGSLTSGHCVQIDASGNLVDAGFACGSGSGSVGTTGSPATGNLTKFSGASTITNGDLTGDVTTSGTVATTLAAGSASVLNSGTLLAARMPALTGDLTTSAGAVATTLATVNSNTGSWGDGTHVGAFTVNGKGLITAASSVAITGAAPTGSAGGDLTGTYPNPTLGSGSASVLNSGTLLAARMPALTGDITTSAGSVATTLAAGSATNLNSGTLAAARGGAGAINGALKGNGSGVVSQAACSDLSNGATGCSTATGTSGATIPLLSTANTWSNSQAGSVTTLAISTATFTPDATNNHYKITLVHASCPCTIANPSPAFVAGTSGLIQIIQSSTGSDTIGTYGSSYLSPGGTSTIVLSTAANAIDVFSYFVQDSTHILLVPSYAFSH